MLHTIVGLPWYAWPPLVVAAYFIIGILLIPPAALVFYNSNKKRVFVHTEVPPVTLWGALKEFRRLSYLWGVVVLGVIIISILPQGLDKGCD